MLECHANEQSDIKAKTLLKISFCEFFGLLEYFFVILYTIILKYVIFEVQHSTNIKNLITFFFLLLVLYLYLLYFIAYP